MHGPELEIELLQDPTPEWRDARARADAGPHLGDGWIAYRSALGLQPQYVVVRDSARAIDAVGVVYLAKSRLKIWKRPVASADCLPRPVDGKSDAEYATARALALVTAARRERWQSLAVESFDGPSPPPDLAAAGFAARERFEFTIDLRPDDDERWSSTKQSHRRKIRKAEKAGVTITTATSAAPELHALQKFTSERRRDQGEEMDYLSEERYRLLCDALAADDDSGLAVLGHLDGEPVSAMLIATHGRRAYYLLGGTNARGLEANAASRVFWEATRTLRERGIEFLNLGGVPHDAADPSSPAHGLYRFKIGWGTTPEPCRSGTIESVQNVASPVTDS